ncbi:MAG: hypothetical protein K2X93_25550, partial [Candidatus Obscuribacterales bacterium]|nr:hypothetical protein [Candidatus Obscuribacterales bacterium]
MGYHRVFVSPSQWAKQRHNVVVGAGSSETEPPSTSLQLNMRLERLAARQIASELAMRNQRGEKRAR